MPLQHLEHFLIQTADLEATRDWYVNILGFREGPHPDFKFPVIWLYLGDTDVIHLTQGGKNVSETARLTSASNPMRYTAAAFSTMSPSAATACAK